ncbi:hypothetical protein ACS0TY_029967 [Phlomoides rotata]
MVGTRGRKGRGKAGEDEEMVGKIAEYEESRAQRMKENMERMKSLGIADLSKQLKRPSSSSSVRKTKPSAPPSTHPPRRSSRLKDMPQVSYSEKKIPKQTSASKNVIIHIPEGENPEIYTEEDEKLLGDSEAVWELCVDGYDEDGQRIYDPHEGKSCHQCRQKTLGLRTNCYKCTGEAVTGQFCGDCLYTRYGENINEVNLRSDWICPVCRGICNCSRCRRDKGWEPTGSIYRKAKNLGYKSVAHYLIYTQHGQAKTEAGAAAGSLAIDDNKEGLSDALTQSGAEKNQKAEDNLKMDSDEEYRGDDYEEEEEDESQ